jgi:hypothetical protein
MAAMPSTEYTHPPALAHASAIVPRRAPEKWQPSLRIYEVTVLDLQRLAPERS